MKTKTQENQTRFRILADKFEMSDVRFEDEGVITSRAENMFGIQVTEVNITVKGECVITLVSVKTRHRLSV